MQEYICECGKTFMTPNSFNGHKSHCFVHLEKTGRLHIRQKVDATNGAKSGKKLQDKHNKKKQEDLELWISEKHTCEKCGKVMIEKFGSGRFCSRNCANGRKHSEETKKKIGKSISGSEYIKINLPNRRKSVIDTYEKHPKCCLICGKSIPYEKKYRSTCSKKCELTLLSIRSKESVIKHGGNLNHKGFKSHLQGNYRGYHCDSTWELAFIVYHLEHDISFERNKDYFPYIHNNKQHNYFPDFKIEDTYYEIKGYLNEQVQAKIDQFPKDKKLVVLYYEDMKHMIDYCCEKYGKNYWETLYE